MTTLSDKDFKALAAYNRDLTSGNIKKAIAEHGDGSADLWNVMPQNIRILPGYNPRIRTAKYAAKIRWLADQMKEHGFYPDKPLAGFVAIEDGKQIIYLQDGEGRLEGVLLAISEGAPIKTVPMVMKDRSNNQLSLSKALVASNGGTDFTAMEKAILVARFKAFGESDADIAKLMQCSAAYVGHLTTLAGAPKKIRDMVINDEISATNAIESIRKHGDKAGEMLESALENAKAKGKGKASAKDASNDPAAAAIARQKKWGPELFALVVKITEAKHTKIDPEFADELDSMLFRIEQADTPKAEKLKKAPAKKAAAKKAD